MPSGTLRLACILSLLPVLHEHGPLLASSYAVPKEETQMKRDTSPVDVCFRWAGQSALINGTLYLYGGQVTTTQGQKSNTWTDDFYSLDLTKTWPISKPALTGLDQPQGPPAVSLGYLWNSYNSLFLYGGEFSDNPPATVVPFSTWEYNVRDKAWTEHQNPTTSDGESAPMDGAAVQRAAEGAGANVPSLGRGFYFGGHLDLWTTPDWSNQIARVYLQSLLEFTFPGSPNKQVNALKDGRAAGTYGNYRNISRGGLQQTSGFTNRADGLLAYVPGFSAEGILIALAGGSNDTFTQMNIVDVFDIATSSWFKQSTSGAYPRVRVNPCAVVAVAADGSSYNIYMFGGQNLVPAGNQTQLQDMWILSVPSFTWIEVDQSGQSVPYGRSGHLCNIWDGQMIMIGGYTGADSDLSCETPGIYTYDLSSLKWTQQFNALTQGSSDNIFSQQEAQRQSGSNTGGLEGSYGYQVPAVVALAIGGGATGGATLTTPVVSATGGPLATGSAVTYSISGSAVATSVSGPSASGGSTSSSSSSGSSSGPNVGAIVAGVIAGLLFLVVCYLLFCTYIYRKRMQLYKRHAEMAAQQARGEKVPAFAGLLATDRSEASSDRNRAKMPPLAAWSAGNDPSERHSSGHTRYESNGSAPSSVRRSGSSEDLMAGHEPTFVGVMLHPRRSLRVINHD